MQAKNFRNLGFAKLDLAIMEVLKEFCSPPDDKSFL